MTIPFIKKKIAGWGLYPELEAHIYRPEEIKDLNYLLSSGQEASYISRGLGRSYGDTALNENNGLILNSKFNHFINFDDETGLLETEAGVSLADILDVFVPRGFFLPVTPGTKYVSLGGAIANDVHGKNHHKDGCISGYVHSFKLLTASGTVLTCSRDQHPDVFWATIGGIGLTGVILSVKITLIPIETAYIEVNYQKAKNIHEALEMFEDDDDHYQYSVAWIDCLSTGEHLGRSVLMRGNHATKEQLPEKLSYPLLISKKSKVTVPFHLPTFTLNQWTIKAFNELYYRSHKDEATKIVDYDSFFYPLDAVNHWNRAYGRNGFVQYQAVFPPETSKKGLIKMLEMLSGTKRSSFLAVLKSFGEPNQGLLSFPFKGHTLALDIPIKNESLFSFIKELDDLVLKMGGRVYLAKDSTLSADALKQMYPKLNNFLEIKQEIDPNGIFSSSMSRRLGLGLGGEMR